MVSAVHIRSEQHRILLIVWNARAKKRIPVSFLSGTERPNSEISLEITYLLMSETDQISDCLSYRISIVNHHRVEAHVTVPVINHNERHFQLPDQIDVPVLHFRSQQNDRRIFRVTQGCKLSFKIIAPLIQIDKRHLHAKVPAFRFCSGHHKFKKGTVFNNQTYLFIDDKFDF